MRATETKLLDFLQQSPQFVIPVYQRTYSWTERECRQLWDDVLRTGDDDQIAAHFVGSIVYVQESMYQVSSQSPLLVIDGQQRLTTVMLCLEALARHLGVEEPLDGFSSKKLRSYYLLNLLEENERVYKLVVCRGFGWVVEGGAASADFGDDFFGGSVPDEGFGVLVPVGGPGFDGVDEFVHAGEAVAA